MGRPGAGGSSGGHGGGHSVHGSGHSMSSHGGLGGGGSHTRPGVGSGHSSSFGGSSGGHTGGSSFGHTGSSFGHGGSSFGHQGPAGGPGHGPGGGPGYGPIGGPGHGGPGNNHYGHQSHHYGHVHHHPFGHNHYNHHYGNRYGSYGYGGYGGYRRASGCNCAGLFAGLIIVVAIIVLINVFSDRFNSGVHSNGSSSVSNTTVNTTTNQNNNVGNVGATNETLPVLVTSVEREKLQTSNAYVTDCIIDNVGWFDDEADTEERLQYFWNKTGVQPVIYIKEYDSNITTEDEKAEWAESYYENNCTDNTFLYVYFDEDNHSVYYDETVGYMYVVSSDSVAGVMDDEAVEIFWNYIDYFWADASLSTDEVFARTFEATAKLIMSDKGTEDTSIAEGMEEAAGYNENIDQAQAELAEAEAALAQAEAEKAEAEAALAQAQAEAAKAEKATKRTQLIKGIIIGVLVFVGIIILVLGGLAIASIIIYNRSQKTEADNRALNTPINTDGAKSYAADATSVSPNSHPLNEKSAVGMSASSRGVTHESTSASERNQ